MYTVTAVNNTGRKQRKKNTAKNKTNHRTFLFSDNYETHYMGRRRSCMANET